MAEKVVPQVVFEIGQVDHLLETYADLLYDFLDHVAERRRRREPGAS